MVNDCGHTTKALRIYEPEGAYERRIIVMLERDGNANKPSPIRTRHD